MYEYIPVEMRKKKEVGLKWAKQVIEERLKKGFKYIPLELFLESGGEGMHVLLDVLDEEDDREEDGILEQVKRSKLILGTEKWKLLMKKRR